MSDKRITFDLIPADGPGHRGHRATGAKRKGKNGGREPLRSPCATSWHSVSLNAIYDLRKHGTRNGGEE